MVERSFHGCRVATFCWVGSVVRAAVESVLKAISTARAGRITEMRVWNDMAIAARQRRQAMKARVPQLQSSRPFDERGHHDIAPAATS